MMARKRTVKPSKVDEDRNFFQKGDGFASRADIEKIREAVKASAVPMDRMLVRAEEALLCFPAREMDNYIRFNGFRDDFNDWAVRLLGNSQRLWLHRVMLEEDASFKQVVVNVVFWDERQRAVWLYRRKGGERRLHGKVSCLVGGHVNATDGMDDPLEACWQAMLREIGEELRLTDRERPCDASPMEVKLIGVVNDETDDVGPYHFGFVYCCVRPSGSELKVGDLGGTMLGWRDIDTALMIESLCEPWTRHVLAYLAASG